MSFDEISYQSKRFLSLFDIPGGVVIGLFSLEILAMIPWCLLSGVPFPATVRDIYLGVIAAFASTNVAKHFSKGGGQNDKTTV